MHHGRVVTALAMTLALLFAGGAAHAAGSDGCSLVNQELGNCQIQNDDESIDIGAEKTIRNSNSNSNSNSNNDADAGEREESGDGNVKVTPRPDPFTQCNTNWNLMVRCVDALRKPEPGEEPPTPTEIPPITITDLARFAPTGSTLTAEPDNLGIAGLPANFIATAQQHTQNGTLFGYPISVRFTPASFTFHYGDGQMLTSDTGGQSWDTLNLPQFSPTDTSHTYTERGTYTARADVNYTAEIDLGVGWFPITGQLTTTGPDQSIRIYEAHTALVAHTCTEKPDAPGC